MKTRRTFESASIAMFKSASVAMAAAMVIAAPLYAAPDDSAPEQPNRAFEKLDTDRDGFISRDEAAKRHRFVRALSEADDNRDGRLDREEFVKAQSVYDRMRAGAYVSDRVITAKVKAALVKNREVSALAVKVDTHDGTVLLSGFVNTEQQALRAHEIAASIAGVKSVKSNLVVKS